MHRWVGLVEDECEHVRGILKAFVPVDTGVEGEVGMNGSSAALTSRTNEFVLTQDTRARLAVQFEGTDNVPRSCLTAGVGTIMDAKEVLAVFSGIDKARALEHCIEDPINHMFPLSILQKHMCKLLLSS